MFTSSAQSILVKLLTESGRLVPFAGTVKVVLTLKFKRFDENQWNSIMQSKLHFLISLDTLDNAAVDWRFGCWFWSYYYTVCTTGCSTGCKKMGRELLMSAAPELIDVAMNNKSPKEALKNTVTKTARKQSGGGRRRWKTSMNGLRRRRSVGARKRKQPFEEKSDQWEVELIFSQT